MLFVGDEHLMDRHVGVYYQNIQCQPKFNTRISTIIIQLKLGALAPIGF